MSRALSRILLGLFLILAIPLVSHAQGTVRELSGKVEIQEPGKGWVAAVPGMKLSFKAVISTGFKSSATVELRDALLRVSQLTRMSIEDLIEKEGTVSTSLNLKVGKVTAQIKTGENLKHDFKLKSPVSTAAVRGTRFTYDAYLCRVEEGVVTFFNLLEQRRTFLAGQQGNTTGYDPVSDPEVAFAAGAGVPVGLLGLPFAPGGYSYTATLVVRY